MESQRNHKIVIAIIPAYNEQSMIVEVIGSLKDYVDQIIVINDASIDQTERLACSTGAMVINHLINRGLGASLKTGITLALEQGADIIITFDADGQLQATDIPKLIQPIIEQQADVVIGSRAQYRKSMPRSRRFYNWVANLITYLFFNHWVSDSQSGLRAFSKLAAQKINLATDRMEISSEIIGKIKQEQLRLKEISIKPIYTSYSLSKGQSFFVGIKTFCRLFFHRLIDLPN
ncbi:MAG: glycosyltransferase family 2 protein [Candidatus Aenigmarchaeota archaeon]|nr:glycosyltransferase family 2 protein [Candidatus Aenigmarchaeota archaeon]